jgi:hypothetical protein
MFQTPAPIHGLSFNCTLQFGSCAFDFGVAVLPSSGSHGKQTAAVNVLEIAIGKFVICASYSHRTARRFRDTISHIRRIRADG